MSHVVKVETIVESLDDLKAAVKVEGFEFRENQRTYRWYGRLVGDSALPEGVTEEELGKCEHAIRVPGASYEVGVVRRKDGKGYELRYDFWGAGGLKVALGGEKAERIVQAYGVARVVSQARRLGHIVESTTKTADGMVRLVLRAR